MGQRRRGWSKVLSCRCGCPFCSIATSRHDKCKNRHGDQQSVGFRSIGVRHCPAYPRTIRVRHEPGSLLAAPVTRSVKNYSYLLEPTPDTFHGIETGQHKNTATWSSLSPAKWPTWIYAKWRWTASMPSTADGRRIRRKRNYYITRCGPCPFLAPSVEVPTRSASRVLQLSHQTEN